MIKRHDVYQSWWKSDEAVDASRCQAAVHSGGWGDKQCSRKATVVDSDGLGWCFQHDPKAVEAREVARRQEEKVAYEKAREESRRNALARSVGFAYVKARESGSVESANQAAARVYGIHVDFGLHVDPEALRPGRTIKEARKP